MMVSGRNIVVAVTGSIAAYKAAEVCSLLKKAGASVRVVMTRAAAEFVTPLTFETLTGHPVYADTFARPVAYEMDHIAWAKWADLLVVAPASADALARMAAGIADDALGCFHLSFGGLVAVAPAMNTRMWQHPATRHNLEVLRLRGVTVIEPASGMLACGDVGAGKLAPTDVIVESVARLLAGLPVGEGREAPPVSPLTTPPPKPAPSELAPVEPAEPAAMPAADKQELPGDDSLAGRTVVITSGPTHEYLDPVRFITNPSSGRMGAALAREAARRGARVHLVSGPVAESMLPADAAAIHRVTTAEQMLHTVRELAAKADIFVFAAAVSDFRVPNPAGHKIKRTGNSISLPLIENPDIAQAIGCAKRSDQVTVGFAAETQDVEANALAKLRRKHLDAIVANDVSDPQIGFVSEDNEVTVFTTDAPPVHIARKPKAEVAREIMETVVALLARKEPQAGAAE